MGHTDPQKSKINFAIPDPAHIVVDTDYREPISDDLQEKFNHGTTNEPNAVSTLVGLILPHYHPTLSFVEEGCHIIEIDNQPMVIVSPDGGLYLKEDANKLKEHLRLQMTTMDLPISMMSIEIKCPFPSDQK